MLVNTAYYCKKHKYNPPPHSGLRFCPYCEFPEEMKKTMVKRFCKKYSYAVGLGLILLLLDYGLWDWRTYAIAIPMILLIEWKEA